MKQPFPNLRAVYAVYADFAVYAVGTMLKQCFKYVGPVRKECYS